MFSWPGFLTYMLVTAITPGPNNLMSLATAGRLGFRRALPFNFGVLSGLSLVMLGCALGCELLGAALPRIKGPLLVLGAAYMLWLAWKLWRSPALTGAESEAGGHRGRFLTGLMLQFVNAKIYVYAIVSMEAYVLPVFAGQPLIVAGFALLLAITGFLSTLCWSGFGSACQLLFSRYARVTNPLMALLLVLCAAALFF